VPSGNDQATKTYDNRQEGSFALSTILTGPDFFRLFPHVWLAGSPSVLDPPGQIVLAESVAIRLRVHGDAAKNVMVALESEWKTLFPRAPFTPSSLKDTIDRLYIEENRMAMLMQSATVIMILISCMGLFGLALFSATRR